MVKVWQYEECCWHKRSVLLEEIKQKKRSTSINNNNGTKKKENSLIEFKWNRKSEFRLKFKRPRLRIHVKQHGHTHTLSTLRLSLLLSEKKLSFKCFHTFHRKRGATTTKRNNVNCFQKTIQYIETHLTDTQP